MSSSIHRNGQASDGQENEIDVYRTTTGRTIGLRAVSPVRLGLIANTVKVEVEQPVKRVETDLPGVGQEFPLTAELCETDAERAALAAYEEAVAAAQRARNEKTLKYILSEQQVGMDDVEEWKEDRAYWGLEVPAHRIDQKVAYIYDKIIGSPQDMMEIQARVMAKTYSNEEATGRISSMFQRAIRRETTRQLDGAFAEVEMELQSALSGDEGGAVVGGVAADAVLRGESGGSGAGVGDVSRGEPDGGGGGGEAEADAG